MPANHNADLTREDAIPSVSAFDLFGCPFPLIALVGAAGGLFLCAHVSLPWWWWGILRYEVGLSCRARAYAVWAAYAIQIASAVSWSSGSFHPLGVVYALSE